MKGAYRGLLILATVTLCAALFVFVAYSVNLITFPYDYDQGEGFELVDTILFSQFEWPYQNTDAYPFYSSNYPPLFHVMAAPFVWLFGGAYWYGRLLGMIGTLIAAIAIVYAVYREEQTRWIALLVGLAFLASNTIYHIAPLFRQHMTMVVFETLAIVILARAFPQRQTGRIALALALLIAAGYTKQLAAITAVIALTWMVLRNPRRGLLWSTGFALVGSAIFTWMTVATNGEWWRQAIVANVNQFDPFQTFGLTLLWLRLHWPLIIPALLLVIYELYRDRLSLYSAWFVGATVLGAFGSGTWGAGDSYFATSIAAMCILSGITFSRVQRWAWRTGTQPTMRYAAALLIPVAMIAYSVTTWKMPTEGVVFGQVATMLNIQPNVMDRHYDSAGYGVVGYANIGHFVTAQDRAAGDQITALVREAEGAVLSEEAGFTLKAGREVITNPTQLRNLWLAGLWNGDDLLAMLEDREFSLIILRAQFYPVPVLEAIGQHYSIEQTISMNGFNYQILRPKPLE